LRVLVDEHLLDRGGAGAVLRQHFLERVG
jgi:hypothetical protein